jgi:hypothetical protein
VRSFTTADPIFSVTEGSIPLISSDPPNAVVRRGSAVTLKLNARGVDEDNFTYLWYNALNPLAGWSAITVPEVPDSQKKTFLWRTEYTLTDPFGGTRLIQQHSGSYFIRVDAFEKTGARRMYTFTSTSPIVTIENR